MNQPDQYKLTDEAFQTYVRNHHKFALEGLGESLTPALLVVTRTADLKDETTYFHITFPFNEDEVKHRTLFEIGKKFFEEEKVVLAVILSAEAWMVNKKKEKDSDLQLVSPRDDPNREECIYTAGWGAGDGDTPQHMYIITPVRRDENNHMHVSGESTKLIGPGRFDLLAWFWTGYFWTGYFWMPLPQQQQQETE